MSNSKLKVNIPKSAWKEQLSRVRRWYARTRPISRESLEISEEELDTLFAFFQNCWHLYDWLKNSGAVSDDILEAFFRKNDEMKLCYDICIGAKHLQIDNPKAGLNVLARQVEYAGEKIGEVPTQRFFFFGGSRVLGDVADRCMTEIETFITANNLR